MLVPELVLTSWLGGIYVETDSPTGVGSCKYGSITVYSKTGLATVLAQQVSELMMTM